MRHVGTSAVTHLVVTGWLIAVIFAITYLIADPVDEVIRNGITVIVLIAALSMFLGITSSRAIARIPLLVLGATAITAIVAYPSARRRGRTHLGALRDDLGELASALRRDVPPIEAEPLWGQIIVILIAAVTVATLVIAIDAFGTFEVLIPGSAFVVVVLTAASSNPPMYSGLVVASGVTVLTVLVSRRARYHRPTTAPELLGRVPAALGLAGVIALASVALAPYLPGARSEAVVDLRARSAGVTTILSPLVDIRSRLTESSDDRMFTVEADRPSYWRIASLPEFDGTTFRLPAAALSTPSRRDRSITPLAQTFTIDGLGGRLVPAAPDPARLSGGLRWNADTDAVVIVDRDLRPGDRFEIESISAVRDPAILAMATTAAAPDLVRTLPDRFPRRVIDLAREVTAEATNDYERALALQFWFREQFEYSLEAPGGHGIDAIERFLVVRRGYCEQFAAAFAAMGRGIGLPTRVAVGFTVGIDTDGRFDVLGRHAHAWPEVWFDDIGWVQFEPTPGRGAPDAELYTGVTVAQDDDTGVDPTADTDDDDESPGSEDSFALTIPSDVEPRVPGPTVADSDGGDDRARSALVLVGLFALLALVLAPVGRRRFNRSRWSHRAPGDQVLEVWQTIRSTLAGVGVDADPTTTNQDWAARASAALPAIERPLTSLAGIVDHTIYARRPAVDIGTYGMSIGHAAMSWGRQIESFVAAERTPIGRFVDYWTRRI